MGVVVQPVPGAIKKKSNRVTDNSRKEQLEAKATHVIVLIR